MASGPITSWEIDGEAVETVSDFIFWAPKSLQMVTAAMKLKATYSLEEKLWPTSIAYWKAETLLCQQRSEDRGTGRLQSMGSRRVGHDWATELKYIVISTANNNPFFLFLLTIFISGFFFQMHWLSEWEFPVLQCGTGSTRRSCLFFLLLLLLLLLSCFSRSDSVWPRRRQPTRLLCPWDSFVTGPCHSSLRKWCWGLTELHHFLLE